VQVQATALGVAQSESNGWEEACWEKEDARDVIPGKTQRVPVKRRPESLDVEYLKARNNRAYEYKSLRGLGRQITLHFDLCSPAGVGRRCIG
jgi:hypothetical protein